MIRTLDKGGLARMVAGAATRVRENAALLSQLDSVAGDGDHGSTMLRCVERMERSLETGGAVEMNTVLHDMGWSVLGVDGGASSSLLGTFFLGMAGAPAAGMISFDCSDLSAAFQAGLSAVRKQTKAQPGDKTMMDALLPAVETLSASAEAGRDIVEALESAADAARAGAEATKNLIARYGRAKFLGEKTRGYQDPGATSIALLFDGFWRGLAGATGEAGNG